MLFYILHINELSTKPIKLWNKMWKISGNINLSELNQFFPFCFSIKNVIHIYVYVYNVVRFTTKYT